MRESWPYNNSFVKDRIWADSKLNVNKWGKMTADIVLAVCHTSRSTVSSSQNIRIPLPSALVRPHLEFCVNLWACFKRHIDKF